MTPMQAYYYAIKRGWPAPLGSWPSTVRHMPLKEAPVQVVIRHPRTDETYEINSIDFRRGKHYRRIGHEPQSYADAGFRIVSLADGRPYEGPLNTPPSERAGGKE